MVISLVCKPSPACCWHDCPHSYLSSQKKGPKLFGKGPVVDVFLNQECAIRTLYLWPLGHKYSVSFDRLSLNLSDSATCLPNHRPKHLVSTPPATTAMRTAAGKIDGLQWSAGYFASAAGADIRLHGPRGYSFAQLIPLQILWATIDSFY